MRSTEISTEISLDFRQLLCYKISRYWVVGVVVLRGKWLFKIDSPLAGFGLLLMGRARPNFPHQR